MGVTLRLQEFYKLSLDYQDEVKQWVDEHFGSHEDVIDCGAERDMAWCRRYVRNSEGKKYFDASDHVADEVVRGPLIRPFPIAAS